MGSAPSLLDQPKAFPIPDEDGIRHSQEQPGAHDAGNRPDVHFQLRRIRYWVDLAIENVIAIVCHEQTIALTVKNRPEAKFAQPSFAQG